MEVERESRRQFVEEDQRNKKQRAEERRVNNTARRRLKRGQEKKQKIDAGSYRGQGRAPEGGRHSVWFKHIATRLASIYKIMLQDDFNIENGAPG